MDATRIEDFLDLSSLDRQIQQAESKLQSLEKEIVRINGIAKGVEVGVANSTGYADLRKEIAAAADIMTQFNGKSKELTTVAFNLQKAQEAAAAAARNMAQEDKAAQEAALARTRSLIEQERELDRLIDREKKAAAETDRKAKADERAAASADKRAQKEAAAADKASNAYEQLKAEYTALSNESKRLQAEDYKRTGSLDQLSQATQDATQKASILNAALSKIEASVGQNQRNVGNYKSAYDGLAQSFQGLLREAPSVQNLQQLFLSWSNQIPQFKDEIDQAVLSMKDLSNAAKESAVNLLAAQQAQKVAEEVAGGTSDAFADQTDSIVDNISASVDQATALKEQIANEIASAEATVEGAAAAATNTEQLLLNAGATTEDAAALAAQTEATILATGASARATVALEAQTVATEQARIAAASQPSVISRLVGSLFSMQTALLAVVFIATQFGGKIVEFFTGTSKAAEDAEKANKKYKDSLDGIASSAARAAAEEIAHLQVLEATAGNTNLIYTQRKAAVDELQKTYPQYLKNLKDEAILSGEAASAIREITEAIYNKSYAQAAEKKFAAAGEQIYDLTLQLRKAEDVLYDAQVKNQSAQRKDANGRYINDIAFYRFEIERKRDQAKAIVDDLQGRLADARAEQDEFLKDAQTFGQKAAGLINPEKDPKPKREKKAKDTYSEQVKADADYTKSLYSQLIFRAQVEQEIQRKIFDNETATDAERLAAFERFQTAALQISNLEASRDLQITQDKLHRIAEIEAKSAKTRTDDEKKLLSEKKQLLQDEISFNLAADLQQTKQINEQAQNRVDFLKKLSKEYADEVDNIGKRQAKFQKKEISETGRTANGKEVGSTEFDPDADRIARAEKQAELYGKIGNGISEVENLERAFYARKFAALDREAEMIDRNLKLSLIRIDKEGGSEEERAKKKATAEEQAFIQQQVLDQRRRALQRRQAQFEKVLTIAQIGLNTAAAITKQLAATPLPAGLPFVLSIGAIGAAQIAAAIATPIPSFEKGGKMQTDGMAQVAEAGPEVAFGPDGQATLYTQKQITYLRKGTEIKTADQTARMLAMAHPLPHYNDNNGQVSLDFNPLIAAGSAGHNKVAGRLDETNKLLRQVLSTPNRINWDA